jgi:hypothetical protein
MKQKTFNTAAMVVFIFAGGLHLIRSIAGWELVVSNFVVPIWVSLVVFLLVAYLAYTAMKLNKK